MRSDFPSATRTEYLSGTVKPKARVTLRRLRLDFGSALYHNNDEAVIDGVEYAGDDYYDVLGQRVIWGDSCVSTTSPYAKLRIVTPAAWTALGSGDLYKSRSTTDSDDWSLSSLTNPGSFTFGQYARLGVYPKTGSESYYVWCVDNAAALYRYDLAYSGWTWSNKTTGYSISGYGGVAVHPVSATEAILVGYTDPYLWAKYVSWSGSAWSASDEHVIYMSDELAWADAHWSDAVVSPDDSNKIVVVVNLTQWGSAHAILFDKTTEIWSQPREVLPSAEQWGNLRVWCSGLTVINSRIWAVTVREPVASRDIPMAHHVALASSPTGIHWRDEGFVTISTLRGKLLYQDDEDYCYVVGNASVARATASNLLGYDNSDLKHQIDEMHALNVNYSGVGSAPEVVIQASNDSDALSDSGLLETGNEVTVELGTADNEFGDICKALVVQPRRNQRYDADVIPIQSTGYLGHIFGSQAYRPPAAKVFDGPYTLYSNFQFDNGSARITVRQVSGTWVAEWLPGANGYVLHAKKPGIALAPHSLVSQAVVARITFQARVSIEGNYIVFWYEDESNYWQAGIYDDAGTQKLVIDRYVDGTKTNKASDNTSVIYPENWYTLYVDARPGTVRAYFNNSESHDFSSPNADCSYDTTNESSGPPDKHHIGLKVEDFDGWEGAATHGTATSTDANSLTDTGNIFTSARVGQYLRCEDQDRKIVSYDTHILRISPGWSDTPAVGSEYGVYPESAVDGPQAYFKELWVSEGIIPYTVDDVIDSMLELAGIDRSSAYTGTDVPTIGSSSPTMRDVDIKLDHDGVYLEFGIWASTTESTGEAAFSCLSIRVYEETTRLTIIEGQGSASPPYTVSTVIAEHPNLVTTPGSGTSRVARLQAKDGYIIVSCDGHYLTSFPTHGYQVGGYAAVAAGTATKTEFVELLDSFIWDANQPAAAAFSKLLRGRRAKIIERDDGSVSVSRFDTALGVAGTYTTPVISLGTGQVAAELYSLIEMVGAEDRAFHIDPTAARQALRYIRADNPTVETQIAALEEAQKMAVLGRQRHQPGAIQLYAPDPALELEDRFVTDGESWIVDAVRFSMNTDQRGAPRIAVQVAARAAPPEINTGVYDTDAYDGTEWG